MWTRRDPRPRGVNDWRSLKQRRVAVEELDDSRARRNDEIEAIVDVARAQVGAECRLILRLPKSVEIDIFTVVIEPIPQHVAQGGAERVVESRRIPSHEVEGQDPLCPHEDLALLEERRVKTRTQQGQGDEEPCRAIAEQLDHEDG